MIARAFHEPRYVDRLARAEQAAAPHLRALGLDDRAEVAYASFARPPEPPGATTLEALRAVPDDAVADLRLALLRRVAESDHGTAGSTHAALRASLGGRAALAVPDLALELALCRFALDLGFGVSLAWRRVALLDPTIAELERLAVEDVSPELGDEAERCIDLLASDTMVMEATAVDRRLALLRVLQRVGQGCLPSIAPDPGDPFGEALRTLLETDADLARGAGALLHLAAHATSVLPDRKRRVVIEATLGSLRDAAGLDGARGAVERLLRRLLVAPLAPRGPGFVTLRPTNQRLARAALWMAPSLLPDGAATLLGELGLRMGTSGKRDNQARDAATASTCAGLLGEMDHDEASAALGRMLVRLRNKPVRKQVEKALASAAERAGVGADELVERSLPTFGLDAAGARAMSVGPWVARIRMSGDGRVGLSWAGPEGDERSAPPAELRESMPAEVAEVAALVEDIRAALRDERQRLEGMLAEGREWPVDRWRRRFMEHPVAAALARRLIWRVAGPAGAQDALPEGAGLMDSAGRPITEPARGASVRLWHPVEATSEEIDAWRDRLVERRVTQPFKQAFRETYVRTGPDDALADRRFADRPLAYGQMRALMGSRGWSASLLGPHDQGDAAVGHRDYPSVGLRAELGHIPAGGPDWRDGAQAGESEPLDVEAFAEALAALPRSGVPPPEVPRGRVEFARSGSLRFTAGSGETRRRVLLRDVPPRLLSEALRDADLFTSVPDPMRSPTSSGDIEAPETLRTRADALRRIIRGMPHAPSLAVVGVWLRVEHGGRSWAISLATGRTLRLPDESDVQLRFDHQAAPAARLPFEDEMLRRVLLTAEALVSGHAGD